MRHGLGLSIVIEPLNLEYAFMPSDTTHVSPEQAPHRAAPDDFAYQNEALVRVSRTFALTIPQLPENLRLVVSNAYLMCRIADTIEDAESLSAGKKRQFQEQFIAVAEGAQAPGPLAEILSQQLDERTLDAERDLVRNMARVIRVLRSFTERQQAAIIRCVRIMGEGMTVFQEGHFSSGLEDQRQLDIYCYHVAGVVGEMLTELFCAHSPTIDARHDELWKRAVSFGQGLQMTNILKDLWDDKSRDVCWLPQQTFMEKGFDLQNLSRDERDAAFEAGLGHVIGVARSHLKDALEYTLLIPRSEVGIRRFCLWAIGMAVLTLRNINRRRDFTSGSEVKISRRSVKATILTTRLAERSNTLLRALFELTVKGLPKTALNTEQTSA